MVFGRDGYVEEYVAYFTQQKGRVFRVGIRRIFCAGRVKIGRIFRATLYYTSRSALYQTAARITIPDGIVL